MDYEKKLHKMARAGFSYEIAKEILNIDAQERPVSMEEVLEADEVFCSGTAVNVTPIGKIQQMKPLS